MNERCDGQTRYDFQYVLTHAFIFGYIYDVYERIVQVAIRYLHTVHFAKSLLD
jgi:hypothetical protein